MNKIILTGIMLLLSGCDNTSADAVNLTPQQKQELQHFIQKEKSEQIFVQGELSGWGIFVQRCAMAGHFVLQIRTINRFMKLN
jgi:hypothetical protein